MHNRMVYTMAATVSHGPCLLSKRGGSVCDITTGLMAVFCQCQVGEKSQRREKKKLAGLTQKKGGNIANIVKMVLR